MSTFQSHCEYRPVCLRVRAARWRSSACRSRCCSARDSSGCSARAIRTRRPATSAISRRARSSASRRFYGVQRGPTSPGRAWLLDVTNVSITPYTYTEDFTGDDAVLSRDNLKIAFRVHTVWRVDEARVPLFMERFSTTRHGRRRTRRSRTRSSRWPTATSSASRCARSRATRCSSATASRSRTR